MDQTHTTSQSTSLDEGNQSQNPATAKIKVYTTKTCIFCHALMDWLDHQGIEYEEISAETMPDITAVPVTEINGEKIIGFDRPAIKKALKRLQ